VLPSLFTGIRLALGFAWTTIVAAETVDGIPGIGGLAWSTKKQMQTDIAVLCIIVIGISAIALDAAVKALERAVVPWRGKG
jgi:taurine transport system permease protein